jgi:hypothetical protein
MGRAAPRSTCQISLSGTAATARCSFTVNDGGRVADPVYSIRLGSTPRDAVGGRTGLGTGTLNVRGGQVQAFALVIYNGAANLDAGSMIASNEYIGSNNSTSATLTQTGGTNSAMSADGTPTPATVYVGTSATNATPGVGTYNLRGGTLLATVSNNALGTFNQSGGTLDGTFTNGGAFAVAPPPTGLGAADAATIPTVTATFTNTSAGTVRVASAEIRFSGDFTNDGTLSAWGGRSHFTSFHTGSTGFIAAGGGAEFDVTGEFRNDSTRAADWDTTGAVLHFSGNGPPTGVVNRLWADGADRGATASGYDDNFVWGELRLDAGDPLTLLPSPSGRRALYVRELLLGGGVDQVRSIQGADGGANLYYDATNPANAYLLGQRYELSGGGAIIPVVPEPGTALLLIPAAWALRPRGRAKRRSE